MLVERQMIPEGLAEMAPGPELAAALAELDLARLSGYDAVVVMQAYGRLEAHVQARKATVMAEVGLYVPAPGDMTKMAVPDKYSADEIRAALTLTRRAAEREYAFAHALAARLPAVRDALNAGQIDKPRALVFCDWLEDVPADLARAVADHLLPAAGRHTTSELKDKIKRLLLAADPSWARRRYERALQRRRVEGTLLPDGTAGITGHQLPLDQAAAAITRVDAIAQQAKRAGLHIPIDHIRTDIFLGLLDGTFTGLDDAQIAAALLQIGRPRPEEDDYDDQLVDNPQDGPGEGPGDGPDTGAGGGPGGGPAGGPGDGPNGKSGGGSDDRPSPSSGSVPEPASEPAWAPPEGLKAGFAAGEIRVQVSTLMHLDDLPAELAGWGPLHAHLARRMAKAQINSQWRYAVCDDDGRLLHAGITRHRPRGWPRRPARDYRPLAEPGPTRGAETKRRRVSARSRGIVELQIPRALLRLWQADLASLGGWAPLIADIIGQVDQAEQCPERSDAGDRRRFAATRLRRWIQIRDRVCCHPGCRAPATRTELDHTQAYGDGGTTTHTNLAATCTHDHDLRDHGWQLTQTAPGHLTWISRTGHHYPIHPPPVIEPLPEPNPQTTDHDPAETDPLPPPWEAAPIWAESIPSRQPPTNPSQGETSH
ncbi:HNH endonuclease signature motif containing protein [Planotetraspora kaengkrachanensis]|uniref:HNH nuclease domain-containing protein n=1 Tax=Planotetraspora kaengkrachanensis TaxID=575193 RepID=A0A8J3M6V4_9ACTN|nr:HNH endonuclease signature motif containing protein [Planotetraspora kaengkrachanensis]GIG80466.1 hypothetical protein Pka01_35930 [Planotetraspora kaengkrachanensis]